MPKCYSEQERDYIIKRLREEAADCMGQYGIRRTTVDEIVKRVHIPKGTFYLFYKSKELLLFDVILEQHEVINQKVMDVIKGIGFSELSVDKLTEILFSFYKLATDMPILKLLNSEEVELLIRKLPEEVVNSHLHQDDDTIEQLISILPVKEGLDIKAISAAFHGIYFATLHSKEIGEDQYENALRTLIRGVVMQMI